MRQLQGVAEQPADAAVVTARSPSPTLHWSTPDFKDHHSPAARATNPPVTELARPASLAEEPPPRRTPTLQSRPKPLEPLRPPTDDSPSPQCDNVPGNEGSVDNPVGATATTVDHSTPEAIRRALERILAVHHAIRDMHFRISLYACRHAQTTARSQPTPCQGAAASILNEQAKAELTALACQPGATLEDIVRAGRGETADDPRPNKALRPHDYRWLLRGYEHQELMTEAAERGLQPRCLDGAASVTGSQKNHQSANRFLPSVVRSVRAGQDGGQYLVFEDALLDSWSNIHVSPFGAVE